jgi:hypothetical protein
MRGSISEISPKDAFGRLFERLLKNLSSWALTTKVYAIIHRLLQDPQLCSAVASELKSKEHMMHSYQKKASDDSFDAKMYAELSMLYSNYLKFLAGFKYKSKVLSIRFTEVSLKVKGMSLGELF